MIIQREIQENIEKWLFKGKILIIYGARQVGKTTLVKTILEKYQIQEGYFNCEILSVKQALEKQDPIALKKFLGDHKIIVLDEAQRVLNIGLTLKLLIDTYPNLQIIATGSSSFDLANKISEPLTGRALEFKLYPFSVRELKKTQVNWQITDQLESVLRFGLYPEIVNSDLGSAERLLDELAAKYLYKDILEFEQLKKPDLLLNLLQQLALQIGNEVSINELANSLGVNQQTIKRYLDLLEKSFVIFRLRSFSRNLRKEITKKQKVYFYDLGIRNSLIGRYNSLNLRDDVGALWENFCVIERMKLLAFQDRRPKQYFWRTHDQKEIDYLEEQDSQLVGYEFKWQMKNKYYPPQNFLETYSNSTVEVVTKDNYWDFLG